MKQVSIRHVIRESTGYFFSEQATQAFNSRFYRYAYLSDDESVYYFVTTETDMADTDRRATVRRLDRSTGRVMWVEDEYRKYGTIVEAAEEARRLASLPKGDRV